MAGLWVRNGWLFVATDRGWNPVKPPKPADLLAPPLLELALYPLVPGAEENVGAVEVAGLNDSGAPAGGGGRRGSEACAGGVDADEEVVWDALSPGGGGYDMINCRPLNVWMKQGNVPRVRPDASNHQDYEISEF